MMTAVKVVTWTRDQQPTTDQKPESGEEGKREGDEEEGEDDDEWESDTMYPLSLQHIFFARTSVCACVCVCLSVREVSSSSLTFFDYLLQTLVLVWAEIIIICEEKVSSAQEKRERERRTPDAGLSSLSYVSLTERQESGLIMTDSVCLDSSI